MRRVGRGKELRRNNSIVFVDQLRGHGICIEIVGGYKIRWKEDEAGGGKEELRQ